MDRTRQLVGLRIGDDPESWARAGFAVSDGVVTIGRTAIELVGHEGGRGIRSLAVDGLTESSLDGIGLHPSAEAVPSSPGATHTNQVVGFDHLVVMSPDVDRTTECLGAVGVEVRRTRLIPTDDGDRRQSFFWLGDVILEMVGHDVARGSGPATAWGLALTCADLDRAASALGEQCGAVKEAVQPGRRIATLRTRDLDISVPIALMSPHPGPAAD